MSRQRTILMACSAMTVALSCCCIPAAHAQRAPGTAAWLDRRVSPDRRATLAEQQMSVADLLSLVHGDYAVYANYFTPPNYVPAGANGSAGYILGVSALSIPALQESDAGTGVADPVHNPANYSTELPSGLATTATWNLATAFLGGAMIGHEGCWPAASTRCASRATAATSSMAARTRCSPAAWSASRSAVCNPAMSCPRSSISP